jgi:hypothetical protein
MLKDVLEQIVRVYLLLLLAVLFTHYLNTAEPFSVFLRRHHCRGCGGVFCANCASNMKPIPELGLTNPVRVCALCFETPQLQPSSPPRPGNPFLSPGGEADNSVGPATTLRCPQCRCQFSTFNRRRTCSMCKQGFCRNCCSSTLPVAKNGKMKSMLVCGQCSKPRIQHVSRVSTRGGLCDIFGTGFGSTPSKVSLLCDGVECPVRALLPPKGLLRCVVPAGTGSRTLVLCVTGRRCTGVLQHSPPSVLTTSEVNSVGGVLLIQGDNLGTEAELLVSPGNTCSQILVDQKMLSFQEQNNSTTPTSLPYVLIYPLPSPFLLWNHYPPLLAVELFRTCSGACRLACGGGRPVWRS